MDLLETKAPGERKIPHYHGDRTRTFLVIAATLMLIGLPFFKNQIPYPLSLSIITIVILIFLAGLTNPKLVWITFVEVTISALGFFVFEYFAIFKFTNFSDLFFWTNQILALLFFFAFYFATKTLRGFYLRYPK